MNAAFKAGSDTSLGEADGRQQEHGNSGPREARGAAEDSPVSVQDPIMRTGAGAVCRIVNSSGRRRGSGPCSHGRRATVDHRRAAHASDVRARGRRSRPRSSSSQVRGTTDWTEDPRLRREPRRDRGGPGRPEHAAWARVHRTLDDDLRRRRAQAVDHRAEAPAERRRETATATETLVRLLAGRRSVCCALDPSSKYSVTRAWPATRTCWR